MPPDVGDARQIELAERRGAEDLEPFRVRRHQAVLDPVVTIFT